MQAKVYSKQDLIGTSTLQVGDRSMGHVYGDLSPTDKYHKNIPMSDINVQLGNGCFLFLAAGCTLTDVEDYPIQLDIPGLSYDVIDAFFIEQPARPFVEMPWQPISIETKFGLEEELARELGLYKTSIFDVLYKNNHPLKNSKFSAMCSSGSNVLLRYKSLEICCWRLYILPGKEREKQQTFLPLHFIKTLMSLNIYKCILINWIGNFNE
jgi:hypothetical protein